MESHEFIYDGTHWARCVEPEEFADYLESESRRRGWYLQHTNRKGKPATMRRKTRTPLEVLTITFPPWLSDWLLDMLRAGADSKPRLGAIRSRWLATAVDLLAGQRDVIGYAFHADTSDPHFDLVVTRQDGVGGRVGSPGLGLAGPWTVGVDRQRRVGAAIARDKLRRFSQNLSAFSQRHGPGAVPLDMSLARALDTAAELELDAELEPYRRRYAAAVPFLEEQHRRAALEVLDAARREILGYESPPQDPEVEL